jgi:hypothetical protein
VLGREVGPGYHEQGQDENKEDFTVEGLPYRQTRIAFPDDSGAYIGTDRFVFVRSKVRLVYLLPVRPRNVIQMGLFSFCCPPGLLRYLM